MQACAQLLEGGDLAAGALGVITPYAAQVCLLRKLLPLNSACGASGHGGLSGDVRNQQGPPPVEMPRLAQVATSYESLGT